MASEHLEVTILLSIYCLGWPQVIYVLSIRDSCSIVSPNYCLSADIEAATAGRSLTTSYG